MLSTSVVEQFAPVNNCENDCSTVHKSSLSVSKDCHSQCQCHNNTNLFSVVFTVFSSFTSVIVFFFFFFFSPFYHILDRVYLHSSDGFPKYEHPLLYFIHFTSVKYCQ